MNPSNTQDENAVLSFFLKYRASEEEPLMCPQENLRRVLPGDRAPDAAHRLQQLGCITYHQGGYLVTMDGEQRYEDAMSNPTIPVSIQEWKTEALTGMTKGGKRTGIMNGVITGPEQRDEPPSPEEQAGRSQEQRKAIAEAARKLGLTPKKFEELYNEGRIKECFSGKQHTGIFHKNGDGKWRSICKDCRNRELRERRKK